MQKSMDWHKFLKSLATIILLSAIYLALWKGIIMISLVLGYYLGLGHYQVTEISTVLGFVIGSFIPAIVLWCSAKKKATR